MVRTILGAIAFYTCLPIPHDWSLNFQGIARWATAVGLFIGGLLGLLDLGLQQLTMPGLVRSVVIVGVWLALTGGLHLDGAIDTADGLAVLDPQRRLDVMADSRTGAFGVMAAVMILLLKVTALASLESDRWIALSAAAGWGRWGQLVAIVRYPYLKPTGKGAFHKLAIRSDWEILPSTLLLLGFSGLLMYLQLNHWTLALGMPLWGGSVALLTGAWFHRQFGGHTGDTYGAVVEWTEALCLCGLTMLI
ncbi:adenosylcobinamide-GDP ribazoletransferase [Pantanalinema rosaneae CENA516]|uniref:adenosylcobinamide-GDP ribazoletransferase n=1 Tax=Pantanalinema rosaneae TaxID=1620701 RepID=UPI003D6F06ED